LGSLKIAAALKMNMKKWLFCFLVLIFGCSLFLYTNTQPSKETTPSVNEMNNFRDLDNQIIDFQSDDLFGIQLSYALGWKPDQEGYVHLKKGSTLGNATVTRAFSQYYVSHQKDASIRLVCNKSYYSISPESAISGILLVGKNNVQFFPYHNAEMDILFLHPRTEDWEKMLSTWSIVTLLDGTTIEIHPIGIELYPVNAEKVLKLIETDTTYSLHWYDAELTFSSITVDTFCQSLEEGVLTSYAQGELQFNAPIFINDEISVNNELFLQGGS